ncbi:hypothetical protein V5799_024813 [Amblyomma americanum]|uniref:Uncharacterized protein n=1 Tax=Amblyomma americanum TaxID=6943 RepID=A0AAQ4EBF7_AMBAM
MRLLPVELLLWSTSGFTRRTLRRVVAHRLLFNGSSYSITSARVAAAQRLMSFTAKHRPQTAPLETQPLV